MNTKRFATKVASTAVVVLIPLTALAPSALAAPRHTAHTAGGVSTATRGSAPNAWASRTSALPDGGAALFDGIPLDGGSAFYHVPAAPDRGEPGSPQRVVVSGQWPGVRRRRSLRLR